MSDTDFGFSTDFLQRLERLAVASRAPARGPFAGPRRSPHHGVSVEFADFRDYAPGDDFRRVDWNAYARLDRLFLRLYSAERMTTLTLIMDHSPSMLFGEPTKALMTARLGAIFTFIALRNFDHVAVLGLGDRLDHFFRGRGGKRAIPEVWSHIAATMAMPTGPTDFGALRNFRVFQRGPGMTIVISDFMSDTDWRGGMRSLRVAGQQVGAVQVLAPDEVRPGVRGDWALCDAETGAVVETSITARVLRRYHDALTEHTKELQEACRAERIAFVQMQSDASLTDVVLKDVYSSGILQ
ncbi:MAG: DUF58 domain-containing protein [Chloroflexota bacterium]